jgi:hypothetical protein
VFIQRIWGVVLAGSVAGCAHTPHVTASYYFPKAGTQISVTQSLACHTVTKQDDPAKSKTQIVVSAAAVTVSTSYSSDYGGRRGSLTYTDLDGSLSDADTALSFTDDGRLAGVNASSTGEASTIIQNATSLASALAPLGLIPLAATDKAKAAKAKADAVKKICQVVKNYGSSKSSQSNPNKPGTPAAPGGPAAPAAPAPAPAAPGDGENPADSDSSSTVLTLTYTTNLKYGGDYKGIYIESDDTITPKCSLTSPPNTVAICPDANSSLAYGELKGAMPIYSVRIRGLEPLRQTHYEDDVAADANIKLTLNRVAIVNLAVNGPGGDITAARDVWLGQVPTPMRSYYDLPIPKAAAFGKQQFTLALSGYGSINKLEYGKTSGTADVLSTAGALAKALTPRTPEQQATALQGQADLIYQTQRLALCQADPKNCSSK